MVPKEITDLLNAIPISEVFSRYGHAFPSVDGTYPCAFHSDGSPSMQIKDNTFFCHSCFAGSTQHDTIKSPSVITAVMALGNLDFRQAVNQLCDWYNIPRPTTEKRPEKPLDPFLDGILIAQERFHQNLLSSPEMLAYLHLRGIDDVDIETWRLGLGDASDKRYAYLNGRIVFSLYDQSGQLVSFTGRLPLDGPAMQAFKDRHASEGTKPPPKYLDRVKGFVKNDHLYGIHRAVQSIRYTKHAYVTEGWTDVISLHRSGVHQAVSSMGLGLSGRQLDLLRSAGAKTLCFIRDGDSAGMKAMLRDAKRATDAGFEIKVVLLDQGMDADDACRMLHCDPIRLYDYFQERTLPAHVYPVEVAIRQSQGEIDRHLTLYTEAKARQVKSVELAISGVEDPSLRLIAQDYADHKLGSERGTNTCQQNSNQPRAETLISVQ
ncbi:toprim domain-containing protein [Rhodococcus sp. IEGM1300]